MAFTKTKLYNLKSISNYFTKKELPIIQQNCYCINMFFFSALFHFFLLMPKGHWFNSNEDQSDFSEFNLVVISKDYTVL